MSFGFSIENLQFAYPEDPIGVLDSEVVVLIGPNNSGKSQALRDIDADLFSDHPGLVIKRVAYKKDGSAEEMSEWLRSTNARTTTGNPGRSFAVNIRDNAIASTPPVPFGHKTT